MGDESGNWGPRTLDSGFGEFADDRRDLYLEDLRPQSDVLSGRMTETDVRLLSMHLERMLALPG